MNLLGDNKVQRYPFKAAVPNCRLTIFTHRQFCGNCRQMPEIRGKLVLVHATDSHVVCVIKDAI